MQTEIPVKREDLTQSSAFEASAELRHAFTLHKPQEQTAPFLFNSPHSGRTYPNAFRKASKLSELELRSSEDAFIDLLFAKVPQLGMPLMEAHFPRAYLDLNREPYELDPTMFLEPLPAFAKSSGPRVGSGLGTIARIVSEKREIYAKKLPLQEAMDRIETLYKPYHQTLRRQMALTHVQFGFACLIDCHSMPSRVMQNIHPDRRPHIILGDRYGTSCNAKLTQAAKSCLTNLGFRVELNRPYAGGFITTHYGKPAKGLHALQIEIDRSLYMQEATLTPHTHFSELVEMFTQFAQDLPNYADNLFLPEQAAAE